MGIREGWRAAVAVVAIVCRPATVAAGGDDERRPSGTQSLVLLVQGDGLLASTPVQPGDPPSGAGLRVRRVRAGEDLAIGDFRARAVLEAQPPDAFGNNYAPIDGGRLTGPLRATEAFVSWTPHVAFHAGAGAMRVPFSRTRQVDDADLPLPERAPFARAITPDFRVGTGVGGDFGALAYGAAVMSSSRTLDGALFEQGAMVAVRLQAEPIGPVGTRPWRRAPDDPWADWFRFSSGVSFLYGTLFEARSIGVGADLSAQWRRFVATAEYALLHAPSGDQQGAAFEPGLTLWAGRLLVVARADWQRAAGANGWGAGAALTLFAPDPRARLQVGFERRTGPAPLPDGGYALVRLTIAIN